MVFVCFGHVISQYFTFEIIDYFKCRSNGSSQPHLDQMLEFSINRPTTTLKSSILFHDQQMCLLYSPYQDGKYLFKLMHIYAHSQFFKARGKCMVKSCGPYCIIFLWTVQPELCDEF